MKLLTALLLSLSICLPALASSEEKEEAPTTIYHDLTPALIGNLADQGNRLKFFKADVSLRVTGTEAEEKLKQLGTGLLEKRDALLEAVHDARLEALAH